MPSIQPIRAPWFDRVLIADPAAAGRSPVEANVELVGLVVVFGEPAPQIGTEEKKTDSGMVRWYRSTTVSPQSFRSDPPAGWAT